MLIVNIMLCLYHLYAQFELNVCTHLLKQRSTFNASISGVRGSRWFPGVTKSSLCITRTTISILNENVMLYLYLLNMHLKQHFICMQTCVGLAPADTVYLMTSLHASKLAWFIRVTARVCGFDNLNLTPIHCITFINYANMSFKSAAILFLTNEIICVLSGG